MNFYWCSDIHCDVVDDDRLSAFLSKTNQDTNSDDLLLITGDISNALELWKHIQNISQASNARLLYVVGNHDYWGGSFSEIDTLLRSHSSKEGHAIFMDLIDRHQIDEITCVVGESGWYDGRNGEQGRPRFIMNDWFEIKDYKRNYLLSERKFSEHIADARAVRLQNKLLSAIEAGNRRIIVITHCPPFVEACRYKGQPSDLYALPWFSSQTMGDVLDQLSRENPDINFEVLCGHTHDPYEYRHSSNLTVHVAGAQYGDPKIFKWKPTLW
jgi:predicted phosphohydrolase